MPTLGAVYHAPNVLMAYKNHLLSKMKSKIISYIGVCLASFIGGFLIRGDGGRNTVSVRSQSQAEPPLPIVSKPDSSPSLGKTGNLYQWLDAVQRAKSADELADLLSTALRDHKQGKDRELELLLLARLFGGSKPESFLSHFDFSDPIADAPKCVVECVEYWSKVDPMKAYDWMRSLPPGNAIAKIYNGIIAGATLKDPSLGLAFVNKSPSRLRAGTAKTWAASIAQTEKLDYWAGYIQKQAADAPEGADQESLAKIADVYGALASQAAISDSEVAARLLTSMPEAVLASKGKDPKWLREVVHNWVTNDSDSMGKWLGTQREAPFYDDFVSVFVERIYKFDRESSEAWYKTIKAPEIRDRLASRFPSQPK